METWKVCGLILKLVILTLGYTGIFLNTDSNHSTYFETDLCEKAGTGNPISFLLSSPHRELFQSLLPRIHFMPKEDSLPMAALIKPEEAELLKEDALEENLDIDQLEEPYYEPFETDPDFLLEVQELVDSALKKNPLKNKVGIYVQELSTGFEYGMHESLTCYDESDGNKDGFFRAASVIKLQMAFVAYRLIENEELDINATYDDTVTGKQFKLLPAIHAMVSQSDNNLLNTMLRLIGKEKVNETLVAYGIYDSPVYGEINPAIGWSLENNMKRHGTLKVGGKITPKDMGMILKAVYEEKDTNLYMGYFHEALLANIYNTRIPRGLETKYPVAHKTGTATDFGVYNDAGIVHCKNPYILVVLTKGETAARAEGFIRELSKQLTRYMDQRTDRM